MLQKIKNYYKNNFLMFWVKNKNTLFIHIGPLELSIGFSGFYYPSLEVVYGGEDALLRTNIHVGLFGLRLSTNRLPFINSDKEYPMRNTGFYIGGDLIVFKLHYLEQGDVQGWKGEQYMINWAYYLKGKGEHISMHGDKYTGTIVIPEMCGLPRKEINLIIYEHYSFFYRPRWFNEDHHVEWRITALDISDSEVIISYLPIDDYRTIASILEHMTDHVIKQRKKGLV